jgi:HSP20 family protein
MFVLPRLCHCGQNNAGACRERGHDCLIPVSIVGIDQPEERRTMSITRWDPWGDIVSLREAMNNLLEESFVRPRQGPSGPGMASSLALDVKETPDRFIVTASVPGVPASDIDITILGDTLRIRGQRKEETEDSSEGGRWLLRERRFGAFERTVSLPTAVNSEGATADFADGVLTVMLPKADVAKPKTIKVSGVDQSQVGAGDGPTEVEIRSEQSSRQESGS